MTNDERAELRGRILDGRYRLGRRIGIGGTGVVFDATTHDGSRLAVKTLRPCFVDHPDLGRRLQREGEVARQVRHPGIVPVLDEGYLEDGSPYIVMPLLTGESLSRLLLRKGELPLDQAAQIASRVAAILHAAHMAGYVHRDVKPEHVLLDRSESGDLVVQLLDFGVCSSRFAPADERQREEGKVFGTPSYVSPEQASGEANVDGRADLFSLGILLFEALSGRLPFTGRTVSKLLIRIIRQDAPRLSEVVAGVDPGFEAIVARLLARERDERFPSARALARAVAPYLQERKMIERRIAASLQLRSTVSDMATTVRRSAVGRQVA
ncbi:MAG: serine/threonine protein kinase [Myxococcales bacterium]|nr:serine/threonine protein kinase [Myxococcales bacterium]